MAELDFADRELLADINAYRVADNEDCLPMLDLGPDGDADVSAAVWRFKAAGWVYQLPDGPGWRLTQRGLDVMRGEHG